MTEIPDDTNVCFERWVPAEIMPQLTIRVTRQEGSEPILAIIAEGQEPILVPMLGVEALVRTLEDALDEVRS